MRVFRLLAALVALFIGGAALAQVPAGAPTPAAPDPQNILYLDLSTGGRVAIELYPQVAPNHVERIKTLTRRGFYNGLSFHRVIDGFMAQTGDPKGDGTGGSDLPDLKAEFNPMPHLRGTVSMARAESPDSANSQFFIMFLPRLSLDGKYTVFGRVLSGMQYVDAIARGEPPAHPDRIIQASIAADNRPEPDYAAWRAQQAAAQQAAAAAAAEAQAQAAAKAAAAAPPPAAARSTTPPSATPSATPSPAPPATKPRPAPKAPRQRAPAPRR